MDDGTVHIVYGGSGNLYHVYYDDTWHIETVDTDPSVSETEIIFI